MRDPNVHGQWVKRLQRNAPIDDERESSTVCGSCLIAHWSSYVAASVKADSDALGMERMCCQGRCRSQCPSSVMNRHWSEC